MIDETKLTKDILTRVQTIYWTKKLFWPGLEFVVLAALTLAARGLVFWQAVFNNLAGLPTAFSWPGYVVEAFFQTGFLVQIVLAGGLVTAFLLARQVYQFFPVVTKTQARWL